MAYHALRDLRASYAAVSESNRVMLTIEQLLTALVDAETGQRGYLLTGDPAYLQPYVAARGRIGRLTDTLAANARIDARIERAIPALRAQIDSRIRVLEETIALRRRGDQAAALALVQGGEGKRRMDAIRRQTAAIRRVSQERLDASTDQEARASRWSTTSLVIVNAALLGALVAASVLLRRNFAARDRATAELSASRDTLALALAERQAALVRVQNMQAQMVQQEKLASLGRLTAGVAHEIKNPLNFVNNFAELATELVGDARTALDAGRPADARAILADVHENTTRILAHGRRADEIVRGMLLHARGMSGERTPTDLHAMLATVAAQAAGPTGESAAVVEWRLDPALDGEPVQTIASAMSRLVLNLVENATHAVRERAGAGEPGFEPRIRIATTRGADRAGGPVAVVTVADNGAGIPDSILPRIFEPFFTTKAPGQGTGLGLSVAHDIAIGHGGALTAGRSDLGGALFTLTIPLATDVLTVAA